MAGRPSKVIDLTTGHRTKAEKEYRKDIEKSLYTGEGFKETAQVKQNDIAHAEFLRLKRLYGKIAYIDALDQQVINRYCLEVANVTRLQELADKMIAVIGERDGIQADELIRLYQSINGVLAKIKSSQDLLLKYEDRLLLNPSGRMRAIPKTPEKKEETSGIAAFLAKRNDM